MSAAWTEERTALLTKRWAEGVSAPEIAKELGGVTRCAVIGKAHRLHLPPHATFVSGQNAAKARVARTASRPPRPRKVAKPVSERPEPVFKMPRVAPVAAPLEPTAPLPGTTPRLWTTRIFGECAYPIGEGGADTLSCCAATGGQTYCAAHRAIAYVPAKKRRPLDRLVEYAMRKAA